MPFVSYVFPGRYTHPSRTPRTVNGPFYGRFSPDIYHIESFLYTRTHQRRVALSRVHPSPSLICLPRTFLTTALVSIC